MSFYYRLIQNLDVVVLAHATATWGPYDPPPFDPVTGLPRIPDPSTVGPPELWPPILYDNVPDPPAPYPSGPYPGRGGGGRPTGDGNPRPPRRTRRGGSARPPNTSIVTHADADPGPHRCFAGSIFFRITKPLPDPFGWNGQQTTVIGWGCFPYNPPYAAGPTTALVVRTVTAFNTGFPSGQEIPAGVTLLDWVGQFLATRVGSDSTAEVLIDRVSEVTSTHGVACTGLNTLAGAIECFNAGTSVLPEGPFDHTVNGTGVGTIIGAS